MPCYSGTNSRHAFILDQTLFTVLLKYTEKEHCLTVQDEVSLDFFVVSEYFVWLLLNRVVDFIKDLVQFLLHLQLNLFYSLSTDLDALSTDSLHSVYL